MRRVIRPSEALAELMLEDAIRRGVRRSMRRPLPNASSGSNLRGIATGRDGNLWFTATESNRIGRITPAGTATIDDNDPLPTLAIGDASVLEGDTGTTEAAFIVTLVGATERSVTVQFATEDGTAKAGSDYWSWAGEVVFRPGETSKTIRIGVTGDTRPELGAEYYKVNLSQVVNALIEDGQGIGTIRDDRDYGAESRETNHDELRALV